jgi:hypothetical protein
VKAIVTYLLSRGSNHGLVAIVLQKGMGVSLLSIQRIGSLPGMGVIIF